MRKAKLLTLGFLLSLSLASHAQKGIIRGSVIDNTSGEPLIGVTVILNGTTTGAATDFDGKFEIATEPGTYTLQVSFISYQKLSIEGVKVIDGEVSVINNIRLKEDVEELAEVVITAEAIKTTEEALLTVKRKSANLLDGISSANFRKIGDSDAGEAVKRVPGVSIEGGKYVYVRGLGDRYTKSTLNGVDIPGLDPDRNTIQMDLFPTNLIDDIIVLKSFTADLPADFTGGIVNIDTKDFPEEKTFSVSASLGYNPNMHFNSNYLTYKGGSTDFLGFDDGTRDIPTGRSQDIPLYTDVVGRPNSEAGQRYMNILQGFNPTLAAMRDRSLMNFGLGVNLGNQITKSKNTYGYNFALVYRNDTEYYEGAEYGRFGKNDPEILELDSREYQKGDFGVNSVSLSGIAGLALKRERAKYKLNVLHSQNGESKAGIFDYRNTDLGAVFDAIQHNLEYSERSLTNVLVNGVHYNRDASWEVEWKISPTRSRIEDPDIRYTRFRVDGSNVSIGTESGYPERIWRFLEEDNLAGKLDISKKYKFKGESAKVIFGGGYTYKQRNYEIQNFQIIPQGIALSGDPNEIFVEENLWPSNDSGTRGTRYEPLFMPNNTNKYDADMINSSVYVSNEFSPLKRFKAILGIRAESYTQHYTGQNQQGLAVDREEVLDDLDLFPSLNLIYALSEKQNLRFSYSRTIARPSFKEASYAEILDPLTGRTFIGGFFQDVNSSGEVIWDGNLTATRIDNFDLRWEVFQKRGQMISLSAFYKAFDRPIEIVQYVQAPNNFQARNVGDGQVMGIEVEVRQSLALLTPKLENLSVTGNVTFTESKIDMTATEYNSRVRNAREGETINNVRSMAGQAPYIINAGLSYAGISNGIEAGLYYNVQGETLQFVGIADKPDVYSVPFHSLNFNANKIVGAEEKMRIGVKVSNILGDKKESVFQSFGAKDQLFDRIAPGTSFSVSLGYNF
ncbi:TonB-dependent receptor [Fulvivirga imtechensis AK7]|uniref:TonB-dependent receptor n=1 Tax=Fulvivirga imtechensis AK7 TaxID=1237149 RepID=L8JMR0_9BACT|nr:TonB-dependent receptor [Fulvivirga imtechensis]ELR69528.1 TonB-dependent receptor [Fulvivirga imtechensis AK7]